MIKYVVKSFIRLNPYIAIFLKLMTYFAFLEYDFFDVINHIVYRGPVLFLRSYLYTYVIEFARALFTFFDPLLLTICLIILILVA